MSDVHTEEGILRILGRGELDVSGQFAWGSNYSFLAEVKDGDDSLRAVYKPSRGERPLWDFPEGTLAQREVAAYLTSRLLGWDFVPPTVLREDGPAGPGSLQLFVEADPEVHYFTFSAEQKDRCLRPVAVFDLLINNADRKGGHILLSPDGRLWLIDHGISFHADDKLRTVIWDFAGQPIPADLLADVEGLRQKLESDLATKESFAELLSPAEMKALIDRAGRLLELPGFPAPGPGRPYPWPLV